MNITSSIFGKAGLVAVALIFVISVSLSNLLFRGTRLDLTENGLYTLSEGTINILGSIPEPINIYFFYSDRATVDTPMLRTYAGRVREILEEFAQHSNGNLRLTMIDPLPFSEEEDRATGFGLQDITLSPAGEPIYMGIAGTNSIGDEEIIAFLDPGKETFLEYDLAKLIDTLASPARPVIGLLSGLPMTSEFDPRSGQMAEPWIITAQMNQLFDVRNIPPESASIDADVEVLMLVHPKALSESTVYAIDQFVMTGGRALIFVDPFAEADVPQQDPSNPAAAMMASRASNLNPLLSAWGVSVSENEIIGDDRFALTVSGPGGQPVRHIGLIGIDRSAITDADIITANISNLNFGYSGFITVSDDATADISTLVESSNVAGPLPTSMLSFLRNPDQLRDSFAPSGENYPLVVRIQGALPSAFAEGRPEGAASDLPHLSGSSKPANILLIADTDILTDRLWAQVQDFFGQRLTTAFAGNGDFVINALDNLTGSGDLISIRGRATFTRPFTTVDELRRNAESLYRQTEQQLQQELEETDRNLSELQASREDSSALILSAEQEAELDRFQDQRLRIRKELRQVQRGLDQQIEDLGMMLKIINIGLVPLLITLLSLGMWIIRKRRAAHRADSR